MQYIVFRGDVVAIVLGQRATLNEGPAALPDGDPELRMIVWMAYYAGLIHDGEHPGPYTDQDAERYARAVLMPAETFDGRADRDDRVLAERYRVPIDQVQLRRDDGG